MTVAVLLFLVGLVCLIKGGDWFVDGSIGIARRFNLPELLIGATVISIGTTLPEVMVSATSALTGHGEIAYGNAIGSIICNTSLIAATTIVFAPGPIHKQTLKTPVLFFFGSAFLYSIVAYCFGYFSRLVGIILLIIFIVYMIVTVKQMTNNPADIRIGQEEAEEDSKEGEKERSLGINIFLLIIGAVIIAIGARLLVDNGTIIAQAIGVPESVIALTFVALGTSLPELVTAITSLLKGHGSLSIGNIIGANIFNLVLVSGVSVTLAPFAIPQSSTLFGYNTSLVLDIPVMFLVMLILTIPALISGKLTRIQGLILWTIYAIFCFIQFTI